MSAPEVAISVVLASYNGASTIATALEALSRQSTAEPFEVIVVDDASTDATATIAARYDVRLVRLTKNGGHGHAMNAGLEAARGRFVAYMDDDCVPPDDWLARVLGAWSSMPEDVTVIGGPVIPYTLDTLNRRYAAFRRPLRPQDLALDDRAGFWTRMRLAFLPPSLPDERRAIYYAVGANMSVRAKAARDVGGFTERRGAGEEESLVRPLRERYGEQTVQYFPDIVMQHDFHPSTRDSLRRARMYGRCHGRDWVLERGLPRVRPLPAASVTGAALVAIASLPLAFLALAASPFFLYRGWLAQLREQRSAEALLYPFIAAGEELADNVGFLEGAIQTARQRGEMEP